MEEKQEKKKRMLAIVKESQYQFLRQQAKKQDMKLSALIRSAIDLLMEKVCQENAQ